ncbi:MAG: thioredoxin family protein [Chloroflexi bacterium]|nr:thioredoxin family protein [Chloroflexota bacterium]
MKIDLLYFDGCPSWETGLAHLQTALAAEGMETDVRMVNVHGDDEAERLQFLGSPSFRLNGQELWPERREQYALGCRVYLTPQGFRGAPTVEALREKIRAAVSEGPAGASRP